MAKKTTKTYTTADIAAIVKTTLVDQLGIDEEEVTPQAVITEDLGADSLDCVELVMMFEEQFGIEIDDDDAEKIHTVEHMTKYLAKRVPVVAAV